MPHKYEMSSEKLKSLLELSKEFHKLCETEMDADKIALENKKKILRAVAMM